MTLGQEDQTLVKEKILDDINSSKESALHKYEDFFVGSRKAAVLVNFELETMFFGPMSGALGLWLRKKFYPRMFRKVGGNVVWGRNISLRHPNAIEVGDRTAIDDNCLLDARGAGESGIVIGSDVLIARDTIIQAKNGPISIGDHTVIGSQTQLSSAGGIQLGQYVMISGQCYIGGGRYYTEDINMPIIKQGLYTKGPVIIEDDVWIGAGAIIQDGVHIGRGSVIGAGAVIREDVPEHTTVVPHQRMVMLPRNKS